MLQKPTKNSTRPYLNEIPAHFTHEIKTKGYDVIGANVFHFKLMTDIPLQKSGVKHPYATTKGNLIPAKLHLIKRSNKEIKRRSL